MGRTILICWRLLWLLVVLVFRSSGLVSSFVVYPSSTSIVRDVQVRDHHTTKIMIRRSLSSSSSPFSRLAMISSGFSFNDGEQILISVQKPLGIVLEQDPETGIIIVSDITSDSAAGKAGLKVGDILMAVQNASTENVDLDNVLNFISNGPRVINLRVLRPS